MTTRSRGLIKPTKAPSKEAYPVKSIPFTLGSALLLTGFKLASFPGKEPFRVLEGLRLAIPAKTMYARSSASSIAQFFLFIQLFSLNPAISGFTQLC